MDEQIQMLDKYIALEERKVLTGNADPTTASTIKQLNDDRSRVQLRRTKYYEELSLENVATLKNVRNNKFLEVRMNALALKTRIRERLRQRKFELAQIERTIRVQSSGKYNLDDINLPLIASAQIANCPLTPTKQCSDVSQRFSRMLACTTPNVEKWPILFRKIKHHRAQLFPARLTSKSYGPWM